MHRYQYRCAQRRTRMTPGVPIVQVGDDPAVIRRLESGDTVQCYASVADAAPLNIPHGVAPSAPPDGDVWTTSTGLFVRISGVTQGPIVGGAVIGPDASTDGGFAKFDGTTGKLLKDSAAKIDAANDITGDLPFTNLTQ